MSRWDSGAESGDGGSLKELSDANYLMSLTFSACSMHIVFDLPVFSTASSSR
jgi:hypothetical protein